MKEKIGTILAILGFCAFLWFGASIVDVGMHNDPFAEDYKEYQEWNAFLIMFGGDE